MNKRKSYRSVAAAVLAAAGLFVFAGNAEAASFSVSFRSPGVSIGYDDDHHRSYRHRRPHHLRHDYDYGHHHRHRARTTHVCRYEDRPVTVRYYDDCGRVRYQTRYESIRVCHPRYHR